jgi:hypothetical protein
MSRKHVIFQVVAGVLSGIVGTIVVARFSTDGKQQASAASANGGASSRSVSLVESKEPGKFVLPGKRPELGAEAMKARTQEMLERFRADVEAHRAEAIAPDWALRSEASLKADMARVTKEHEVDARILRVRCASVTCSVDVEWPSFATARETYARFVEGAASLACGTGIMLPEPADATAPYRGTLLLDCRESRAANAKAR